VPIEILLGRALAIFAHPSAAWGRLSRAERLTLLLTYFAAGYCSVFAALFVLSR
jgi:hypothetical protein